MFYHSPAGFAIYQRVFSHNLTTATQYLTRYSLIDTSGDAFCWFCSQYGPDLPKDGPLRPETCSNVQWKESGINIHSALVGFSSKSMNVFRSVICCRKRSRPFSRLCTVEVNIPEPHCAIEFFIHGSGWCGWGDLRFQFHATDRINDSWCTCRSCSAGSCWRQAEHMLKCVMKIGYSYKKRLSNRVRLCESWRRIREVKIRWV